MYTNTMFLNHLAAMRGGTPSPELESHQSQSDGPSPATGSLDYSETVHYSWGIHSARYEPQASACQVAGRSTRGSSPLAARAKSREDSGSCVVFRSPLFSALPSTAALKPVRVARSVTVPQGNEGHYDIEVENSRTYQVYSAKNNDHWHPYSRLRNEVNVEELSSSINSNTEHSSVSLRGGGSDNCGELRENIGFSGICRYEEYLLVHPKICRATKGIDHGNQIPFLGTPSFPHAKVPQSQLVRAPRLRGEERNRDQNTYYKPGACPLITTLLSLPLFLSSTFEPLEEPPNTKIPRLRGGGRPGWDDADPLPPTLWWLACGSGKPGTIAQWKRQWSKRRMSGFLGMAVYGHKAGTPYAGEEDDSAGGNTHLPSFMNHLSGATGDADSLAGNAGSFASSSVESEGLSVGDAGVPNASPADDAREPGTGKESAQTASADHAEPA